MVFAFVDAQDIADTSIEPWRIVAAIVSVVAAWVLSRIVRRALQTVLGRIEGMSGEMRQLVVRAGVYLVLFVGLGVALSFLGAHLQPLLATAVIVGVVAFLALRGIADNFAAGIVIQTRRPLKPGDEIEALGFVGTVTELNSRAVIIQSRDGRTVHLPNAEVLANPMVNHTALGARRSDVEVRMGTGDAAAARKAVLAATGAVAGVLAAPPPEVVLTGVDPGRVTLLVRLWHAPTGGIEVVSAVIEAIAATAAEIGGPVSVVSPPPPAPITPPPTL